MGELYEVGLDLDDGSVHDLGRIAAMTVNDGQRHWYYLRRGQVPPSVETSRVYSYTSIMQACDTAGLSPQQRHALALALGGHRR